MRSRLILQSAYAFGCALAFGCANGEETRDPGGRPLTGAGGSTTSSATAESSSSTGDFDGGSGTGGSAGPLLIYAHTDDTLYLLDPESDTLTLTEVGPFGCVADGTIFSMTDFAVDKGEQLWAISAYAVHPLQIDGTSVPCGQEIALQTPDNPRFYGLTFAPVGVLDPAKEVLVAGNTGGEVWAIDDTGALSLRGNFGTVPANDGHGHSYPAAHQGTAFALSGDIVFLANDGDPVGFATVRDCSDPLNAATCNTVNTLIEIDVPKLATGNGTQLVRKSLRGQIVKAAGCADGTDGVYGNMYGIAAWKDKVYGFSRSGSIVEIDTTDGTACQVVPNTGLKFAGAGVTTLAPVIPLPE